MEQKIIVVAEDELRDIVSEAVSKACRDILSYATAPVAGAENEEEPERFVYGIAGISRLFNVSKVTAQRYKASFLAPAVMQRGNKIITDVRKARLLFAEASKKACQP